MAKQSEQVQEIPISELFPFKDHPFRVLDDEAMRRTVESMPSICYNTTKQNADADQAAA